MRLRRDVNSGGFPITLQSSFHILGRCQNSGLGFHFARRPRWITIIACPQFLTFCVSFRPLRPDAGGLRHLVSGRGGRNVRRRPLPENMGHSPNAVSMLAHRLRRWPNIETTLSKCPVFAGRLPTMTGSIGLIPADSRRWINAGLALVQRRRRWTNVKPTLIERLVEPKLIQRSVSAGMFSPSDCKTLV